MGFHTKTRVAASVVSHKPKKSEDHILLSRGLSARYCGANTPLSNLTSDEMERDLRHMEAFANACTAYAQQYYIYQSSQDSNGSNNSSRSGADGGRSGKKNATNTAPQPLIAMPVRIDPEEEKRLMNLRQKIQHCEAQREILESQYLSLRAHYVYLSQKLKNFRGTVNNHVEFLQGLVQKRGKLVGLQRARLQMAREVLEALQYRQASKVKDDSDDKKNSTTTPAAAAASSSSVSSLDLVEIWTQLEEKLKKAEQECRSAGVEQWHALKVPQVPPGVPLLLSQLSKSPSFAAAWGTGGMFGSKKESMCWLEPLLPVTAPNRTKELAALREEENFLKRELDRERNMNKDLQTNIIARRKKNDELVAMLSILRTETETVVARHNILLESDQAKDAAYKLHEEEMSNQNKDNVMEDVTPRENGRKEGKSDGMSSISSSTADQASIKREEREEHNVNNDDDDDGHEITEDGEVVNDLVPAAASGPAATTSTTTTSASVVTAPAPAPAPTTSSGAGKPSDSTPASVTVDSNDTATPSEVRTTSITKTEDNENDGDDEGFGEDEDEDEEGEILEGDVQPITGNSSSNNDISNNSSSDSNSNPKRGFDQDGTTENGSPRTKRRKL